MLKKAISNTLFFGIGQHAPKVISLVLIPIITPFLTADDYGVYGLLVAYIGSTAVFKQLGFSVILSNSFFKHNNRYKFIWSRIFGFLLLWNLVMGIIYALIIPFILPDIVYSDLVIVILLFVLPTILFDTINFIGAKSLQYAQRALPFGVITVFSALIGYAVLYLSVVNYNLGYLGWLWSSFSIAIVSGILYAYLLLIKDKLYPSFKFNYIWLKKRLKIALPAIPHFYSVFLLTSSDRIMMDIFKVNMEEIGKYSLAYQIGGYFSLLGVSLGTGFGPILTKMFHTGQRDEILKITKFLSALFIAIAFILALWMKEIFYFLVKNEELRDSYPIAIIVVFSFTYYPFYLYTNLYLQFIEKTKKLLQISLFAGVINIILNIYMIPKYGVFGAAITTFVGYMWMAYSGFYISNVKKYTAKSINIIVFSGVTLGLTMLFQYSNIGQYFILKLLISVLTISILFISYHVLYRRRIG